MTTDYVFLDSEKETGTALIMVDETVGQNQILVVSGACDNITSAEVERTYKLIDEGGHRAASARGEHGRH